MNITQDRVAAIAPVKAKRPTAFEVGAARAYRFGGWQAFEEYYARAMQELALREGNRKGFPVMTPSNKPGAKSATGKIKKTNSDVMPMPLQPDAEKVLQALLRGPVTTDDINDLIGDDPARRKLIIASIRGHKFGVDARRDGHEWTYILRRCHKTDHLPPLQWRMMDLLKDGARTTDDLRAEFETAGQATSTMQLLRGKGFVIRAERLEPGKYLYTWER